MLKCYITIVDLVNNSFENYIENTKTIDKFIKKHIEIDVKDLKNSIKNANIFINGMIVSHVVKNKVFIILCVDESVSS